jgi:hypothetical protein
VNLGWTGGRALINAPGTDFVVYESGSSGSPEGFMVQVQLAATSAWTNWYYFSASTFAPYVSTDGAFATEFEMSNMGVPAYAAVCGIRIANLVADDRINLVAVVGEGEVVPHSGSLTLALPDPGGLATFSSYPTASLDPDPLYVGVLSPMVTPAASINSYGANCGGAFAPALTVSSATIGTTSNITVTGGQPSAWGALFFGPFFGAQPLPGVGCNFYLYNPGSTYVLFLTNGVGSATLPVFLPNDPLLNAFPIDLQAIVLGFPDIGATNGVHVVLGYK